MTTASDRRKEVVERTPSVAGRRSVAGARPERNWLRASIPIGSIFPELAPAIHAKEQPLDADGGLPLPRGCATLGPDTSRPAMRGREDRRIMRTFLSARRQPVR